MAKELPYIRKCLKKCSWTRLSLKNKFVKQIGDQTLDPPFASCVLKLFWAGIENQAANSRISFLFRQKKEITIVVFLDRRVV